MEKLDLVFKDFPDTTTPLNSDNLNMIVDKINECVEQINKMKEK